MDKTVYYEIVNQKLHNEVLKQVNEQREKEGKSPLMNLLPLKAHNDDAKYDVFAQSVRWDDVNDCWVYGINLKLEPPKGQYLKFVPRSSNRKTECYLANSPSTGDHGYRGEYIFCFKPRTSKAVRNAVNNIISLLSNICRNINLHSFADKILTNAIVNKAPYDIGDRIVQMSREYVNDIDFEYKELNPVETERGAGGHGSSGK